jgi:HEAT repeat protein
VRTRGCAQAAEALQCSHEPRAIGPLIEALRDASAEVRFWAAFALGELGGLGTPGVSEAVPELERLAATDQEVVPGWWSVSKEAADALDRLRAGTDP